VHSGTRVNTPSTRGKISKEGLINKGNKVITLLGKQCLEIITFPAYVLMFLTMEALRVTSLPLKRAVSPNHDHYKVSLPK
jgi:hypothetical protein